MNFHLVYNWTICLILIESVPDLLLIFSLQLFVVWIYKQTGFRVVSIYAFNDERVYFFTYSLYDYCSNFSFFPHYRFIFNGGEE